MTLSVARGRMPRRLLAIASSATLIAGIGLVTAPAAFAEPGDTGDTSIANASAQYLSVTGGPASPVTSASYEAVGTELDAVSASGAAAASNPGGYVDIALGSQNALAATGGRSWAAAGGVTASGDAAAAGKVDIDLGKLLTDAGLNNGIVEKFKLSLHEIAAVAARDAAAANEPAATCGTDWSPESATNCRDYTLKSGTMSIESNAIKALMGEIQTVAGQIDAAIGTVTADVPSTIADYAVTVVDPFFNPIRGLYLDLRVIGQGEYLVNDVSLKDPALTISLSGTVASALAAIVSAPRTVGGVTMNLGAGTIDVNYDAVMGGLNGLAPNTPLFGSAVVSSIQTSLDKIIDDIAAELPADIEQVLRAINVQIEGSIDVAVNATKTTTKRGACIAWWVQNVLCKTYAQDIITTPMPLNGSLDVSYDGPSAPALGTLWELLHAQGSIGFELSWDPTELAALPGVWEATVKIATAGLNETSPWSLSVLGLDTAFSSLVDTAIQSGVDALASSAKSLGRTAVQEIADLMNSASSVFGGTINKQVDDGSGIYTATALELWFNPSGGNVKVAKLRGGAGSAFKAAPAPAAVVGPPAAYVGPPGGATVIRLATVIVGQNLTSHTPTCAAGMQWDPARFVCVPAPGPGPGGTPGTPGGTTPGTGPTTPEIVVDGEDNEVTPIVKPEGGGDIEVEGVTQEVVPEAVDGLAATGPHETGIMLLIGLELLLAGVAISRVAARRRPSRDRAA